MAPATPPANNDAGQAPAPLTVPRRHEHTAATFDRFLQVGPAAAPSGAVWTRWNRLRGGRGSIAVVTAADGSLVARPQLPAPDHTATAGNGSGPSCDSRARVGELVARERATGTRLTAREVAVAGISQRRAYELLCAALAEDQQP